ncbi:MAG: metallophosphoesterase [Lachnospiraceae bacterium]|nr:metallophosphoesterase [Lachnospiraceae bacterium]
MKILIVSDTHRMDENLKKVIAANLPIDMLIHLGDAEGSEAFIPEWVNPGCEMQMVRGNNDFFSSLDREREIVIGKYRILLTHGHYYSVSLGAEQLTMDAKARNFDIAMFGHTHRPYFDDSEGIIVLNPGSLSYPRQEGRKPSYMIMELDENGDAHFTQHYLG